jgi:membrane protease YdiL (CAAX protease family)
MSRRYLEVTGLVGVWMALGFVFALDANAYLLAGVPLMLAFQALVRRRPIAAMWVRDADAIRLDLPVIAIALVLALTPAYLLVTAHRTMSWVVVTWFCCAIAGALPAAFAIRQQRRDAFAAGLRPALWALFCGLILFSLAAIAMGTLGTMSLRSAGPFLRQFALYFPVCFVLEEVVFRGVLDAHLADGETATRGKAWGSALFVSVLWGLWHLPIVPLAGGQFLWIAVPQLLVFHCAIGPFLSFAWRSGGTLLLPALAHALIDSYRNVALGLAG